MALYAPFGRSSCSPLASVLLDPIVSHNTCDSSSAIVTGLWRLTISDVIPLYRNSNSRCLDSADERLALQLGYKCGGGSDPK